MSTVLDQLFSISQLPIPTRTQEERAQRGDNGRSFPAGSIGELLSSAEAQGITAVDALVDYLMKQSQQEQGDADEPDT